MTKRGWEGQVRAHHDAVARFAETAGKLDDVAWHARPAPDKWCPGQVAEHLALTYEKLASELARPGGGLRARLPAWKSALLRWRMLPGILRTGEFPKTPAVREIRPPDTPREKSAVLEALQAHASRFEAGLTQARERGGGALTHPYFGRLAPHRMLGLIAAHTEHHRRQLPGASAE
jgi:hypothetical protein